mgnify:CR=1 FL=1
MEDDGLAFDVLHEGRTTPVRLHCIGRHNVLNACACFAVGRWAGMTDEEIAEQFEPQCPMYLSPVFGRIDPAEIVEIMKEQKMGSFRLQLQLHKFIWDPNARGV